MRLACLRTRSGPWVHSQARPGLAIIITLEAAQLELQKIESMTTSIPLERDRDPAAQRVSRAAHKRRRPSAGTSRTARQAGSNEPSMQSAKAATRIGAT